jgi:hypothetical protein
MAVAGVLELAVGHLSGCWKKKCVETEESREIVDEGDVTKGGLVKRMVTSKKFIRKMQ